MRTLSADQKSLLTLLSDPTLARTAALDGRGTSFRGSDRGNPPRSALWLLSTLARLPLDERGVSEPRSGLLHRRTMILSDPRCLQRRAPVSETLTAPDAADIAGGSPNHPALLPPAPAGAIALVPSLRCARYAAERSLLLRCPRRTDRGSIARSFWSTHFGMPAKKSGRSSPCFGAKPDHLPHGDLAASQSPGVGGMRGDAEPPVVRPTGQPQ